MSACVCVHESQSPLRASRQQTHCGIWCFLRIDSRPAPAAFPLAGSTACLRLRMLSKVKAVATCACFFFGQCGSQKKSIYNSLTLPLCGWQETVFSQKQQFSYQTQTCRILCLSPVISLLPWQHLFIVWFGAPRLYRRRGSSRSIKSHGSCACLSLSEVSWQTEECPYQIRWMKAQAEFQANSENWMKNVKMAYFRNLSGRDPEHVGVNTTHCGFAVYFWVINPKNGECNIYSAKKEKLKSV